MNITLRLTFLARACFTFRLVEGFLALYYRKVNQTDRTDNIRVSKSGVFVNHARGQQNEGHVHTYLRAITIGNDGDRLQSLAHAFFAIHQPHHNHNGSDGDNHAPQGVVGL